MLRKINSDHQPKRKCLAAIAPVSGGMRCWESGRVSTFSGAFGAVVELIREGP